MRRQDQEGRAGTTWEEQIAEFSSEERQPRHAPQEQAEAGQTWAEQIDYFNPPTLLERGQQYTHDVLAGGFGLLGTASRFEEPFWKLLPGAEEPPQDDDPFWKKVSATVGRYKIALSQKKGRLIGETIPGVVPPVDKAAFEDDFGGKVAEGLGSSVGFVGVAAGGMLLGIPPPITIGILGAMTESTSLYLEAEAAGASELDRWMVWTAGIPLGASEMLPIAGMIRRLDRRSGGLLKHALIDVFVESGEEFVQEGLIQTLGGNIAVHYTYDEDRDLLQDVAENGLAGLLSAAILSGGFSAGGGALRKRGTRNKAFDEPGAAPPEMMVDDALSALTAAANEFELAPEVLKAATERVRAADDVEAETLAILEEWGLPSAAEAPGDALGPEVQGRVVSTDVLDTFKEEFIARWNEGKKNLEAQTEEGAGGTEGETVGGADERHPFDVRPEDWPDTLEEILNSPVSEHALFRMVIAVAKALGKRPKGLKMALLRMTAAEDADLFDVMMDIVNGWEDAPTPAADSAKHEDDLPLGDRQDEAITTMGTLAVYAESSGVPQIVFKEWKATIEATEDPAEIRRLSQELPERWLKKAATRPLPDNDEKEAAQGRAIDPSGGEHKAAVDRFLVSNRQTDENPDGLTEGEINVAQAHGPRTDEDTYLSELGEQSGTQVIFVDAGRPLNLPAAHSPGVVILDSRASPAERSQGLLYHELWHELGPTGTEREGRAEAYGKAQKRLEAAVPKLIAHFEKVYAQRWKKRTGKEFGEPLTKDETRLSDEEIAAKLHEEAIATMSEEMPGFLRQALENPGQLEELERASPGILQKLRDAIVRLINRLLGKNLSLSKRGRLEALRDELAVTGFEKVVDPALLAKAATRLARANRSLQELAVPTAEPGAASPETTSGVQPPVAAPQAEKPTSEQQGPPEAEKGGEALPVPEEDLPPGYTLETQPNGRWRVKKGGKIIAKGLSRQQALAEAWAQFTREAQKKTPAEEPAPAKKPEPKAEKPAPEERPSVVRTLTGREIPAPPQIRTDTERKAQNDLRKQRQWLKEQAIAEAEARDDEFNRLQFEQLNPKNWTTADGESASQYLFGDEYEVPETLRGPAVEPTPGVGKLSKLTREVTTRLLVGEDLGTKAKMRAALEAVGIDPEALDGQEARDVDEAIEAGVVRAARAFVAQGRMDNAPSEEVFRGLVALYNRRPKMTARTSETVALQQFSTPVPLGYLASQLAGVFPTTPTQVGPSVYEPTAGHGSLLIDASNAHANEIDAGRREALSKVFDVATGEDATTYDPLGSFAAILANPPFSKRFVEVDEGAAPTKESWRVEAGDEAYTTDQIDHAIAWKALEQMHGEGRAVLILGGPHRKFDDAGRKRFYRTPKMVQFFKALYWHYNVTDHFTVAGKLYDRQGSAWPVDVIVIEGRKSTPGQPSGLQLPGSSPPVVYSTWTSLEEKLDDTKPLRVGPRGLPTASVGGDGGEGGGASAPGDVADAGGRPGGRPDEGGVGDGTGANAGGGVGVLGGPGHPAGGRGQPGDRAGGGPGAGVGPTVGGRGGPGVAGAEPGAEPSGGAGDQERQPGDVAGAPGAGTGALDDIDAIVDAAIAGAFNEPVEGSPVLPIWERIPKKRLARGGKRPDAPPGPPPGPLPKPPSDADSAADALNDMFAVAPDGDNLSAGYNYFVREQHDAWKAGDRKRMRAAMDRIAEIVNEAGVLRVGIVMDDEARHLRDMMTRNVAVIGRNAVAPDQFAIAPDSKAFADWFQDSKVVDEDGKPLVVYHGTTRDFTKFDPDTIGENQGEETGFFFTEWSSEAAAYAGDELIEFDALYDEREPETPTAYVSARDSERRVIPVYISASRVLTIDGGAESGAFGVLKKSGRTYWDVNAEAQAALDSGKWDAVHLTNVAITTGYAAPSNHWIVRDPTKIKSATGNRGTFSQTDPDIRFAIAPTPNEMGFYSGLEQAAKEHLPGKSASVGQVRALLKKGVKQEEWDWALMEEFLEGKTKVDREELLDWIKANTPILIEYRSGDEAGRFAPKWGPESSPELNLPGGTAYREVLLALPEKRAAPKWTPEEQAEYERLADTLRSGLELAPQARSRYTALRAAQERANAADYVGGHWRQKNVLAWLRLSDRTDAQGRRILFIEEAQSDWHAAGRQQGYTPKEKGWFVFNPRLSGGEYVARFDTEQEARDYLDAHPREILDYSASPFGEFGDTVPQAPWKTSWPLLALKRAVVMAANGGYDAIGWTTGVQQIERNTTALRSVVDEIGWSTDVHGKKVSAKKDGADKSALVARINEAGLVESASVQGHDRTELVGKPIEDVVGKSIARRILSEDSGTISEEGLTIGGKFHRLVYDTWLPKDAKKIGKKFGALPEKATFTVEPVESQIAVSFYKLNEREYRLLNAASKWVATRSTQALAEQRIAEDAERVEEYVEIHALPLTDGLRETAVTEGFSSFAIAPLSEEKYQKAKPLFESIVKDRGILATNISEVATAIVQFLRDVKHFTKDKILAMKDYIVRFAKEYSQTEEKAPDLGEKVDKSAAVEDAENRHQVAYEPASAAAPIGTQIPTNQKESVFKALKNLQKRHGDVDEYVAKNMGWTLEEMLGTEGEFGYLAAEQIDAVAMAMDNTDKGAGFIIGDQCVAAETRIYDPITGKHESIKTLAERGKEITVLSLTKRGLRPAAASCPFRKGVADLYRITLSDGREILATDAHRFLTPHGWTSIDGGLAAGHSLASAEGPPASSLGFGPSARGKGDRRSTRRPEDSLDGCSSSLRQHGGQPLGASGSGPASSPSQGGVLGHTRPSWRSDDQEPSEGHTHPRQSSVLLSRSSSSPSESRAPSSLATLEPSCVESRSPRTRQGGPQSRRCSVPPHRVGAEEDARRQERPSPYSPLPEFDAYAPFAEHTGWRTVTSIEFVRRDEFFDMWVPGYENYVAEGFVNHNTGVGKGRPVATMIQYAKKKGLVPVFVTQSTKLYSDMVRDLEDTGYKNSNPFTTDVKLRGKDRIMLPRHKGEPDRYLSSAPKTLHADTMHKMTTGGGLVGNYDMVFTTYNQMNLITPRGGNRSEEVERHAMLRALAPNAFLILDESHEAGGTEGGRTSPDAALTRAQFVRQLVAASHSVVYSSATYAKRPQVMTLYSKTDMALAVDNIEDLEQAISIGGVPLQQVVSNMLVEAGQYLRRERSYDGVEFQQRVVATSREQMDRVSSTLRTIFVFDKEMKDVREAFQDWLATTGQGTYQDVAIGDAGLINAGFSSLMHNLVSQTLLSSKADAAADRAIESLKNGEKPVIALSNTMGAFLEDYIKEFNLANGDSVSDLTFNKAFMRYLERTRRMTVKNSGGGERTHVWITDEWMNDHGFAGMLKKYHQTAKSTEGQDFSELPVSPIDHLRKRLTEAGYNADEITGRAVIIEYGEKGEAILRRRDSSDAAKGIAIFGFNEAEIDALILNQAGFTGVSLHASEKFREKGDKPASPRRMIILQPEANVDTFMQALGRIHRTGQIHLPVYELLLSDAPAERRVAAKLMKKLGSLNANTSASKEGAVRFEGVVDFMNKYGDEIVMDLLTEERDIADMLGIDVTVQSNQDNVAAKATGRLAILPLAEQEQLLDRIEQEYLEHIKNLDALGLNALESPTVELDAVVTSAEAITEDKGVDSPFARPAILETLDAKKLERPLLMEEIQDAAREVLLTDPLTDVDAEDDASLKAESRARFQAMGEPIQADFATEMARLDEREQAVNDAIDQNEDADGVKTGLPNQDQMRAIQRIANSRTQIRDGRAWLFNFFTQFSHGSAVHMNVRIAGVSAGNDQGTWVSYRGLVIDIRRKGRAKSALSAFDYEVVLRTSQNQHLIRIPLSKVKANAVQFSPTQINKLAAEIEYQRAEGRETRHIVTGNILAGFPMFGGEGRIVFFKGQDGSTRQGILIRNTVDPHEVMEGRPVQLTTGQVVRFMDTVGEHAVISTRDRVFSVQWRGQVYELRASSRGNKPYVLNPSAGRVVHWEQRRGQKYWSATARNAEDLQAVLDIYAEHLGAVYYAHDNRDAARRIVGDANAESGESAPPSFAISGYEGESIFSDGSSLSEAGFDRLRRYAQDYFLHIKRVQEAIEGEGVVVPEHENTYLHEEMFLGRIDDKIRLFRKEHVAPLFEFLAEHGISFEDASLYVYARGAPSRNKVMEERFPKKFGEESRPGSGMRTSVAKKHVQRYEAGDKAEAYRELWTRLRVVIDARVEMIVETGLETQETVDGWKRTYGPNYIPFQHEMEERPVTRTGSGYQVTGPESFRAKGRLSVADSPLGFILLNMERTIIRAEKTRVNRSLLRLIRANPDPRFWAAKPEHVDWQLEEDGVIYPQRRPVEAREVVVKEKGREIRMSFADELIPRAIKRVGVERLGAVFGTFRGVMSYLRAVYTKWDVEFLFTNIMRDLGTAGLNLTANEGRAFAQEVMSPALLKAARAAAFRGLREKGGDTETDRMWDEFTASGGKMSWWGGNDLAALQKGLVVAMRRAKSGKNNARDLWVAFAEWVDAVQSSLENTARFSAYIVARRRGWSKMQSGSLAKNLTVNFQRKGEWGAVMDAAYLFYGASMQGTKTIIHALRSKRGKKIAGALIAAGLILDLMNRLAAPDGDDGENLYDALPDYIKERYLIFWIPGSKHHIRLPLMYGWNVFPVIGQATGQVLPKYMGGGGKRPTEAASHVWSTFTGSFVPFGGSSSFWQTIMPTIGDPFYQYTVNETFYGAPIRPEPSPYGPPKPDSQLYWNSTSPTEVGITRWLNEVSFGSEVKPGLIDISPESIEHFGNFLTGGPGRILRRSARSMERILRGEDSIREVIPDLPILRRFYGYASPRYGRKYYDTIDQIRLLEAQDEIGEKVRDDPLWRYRNLVDANEKRLKKLRKFRDNADDAKDRNRYEARINAIMANFLKRTADAR